MKIQKRSTDYKFWLTLLLLSILAVGETLCQETPSNEDSVAITSRQFALSDIPSEFNALSNHLIEISEIIQADEKIENNGLIVREYTILLEESKKEIVETLPTMSYQRLENLIRDWHNYKSKFDLIQKTLVERINEIESVKNEMGKELGKWEDISEELKQDDFPEELMQNADTAVVALNVILEKAIERSDTLLLVRSKQTQLNLLIDEMIRMMEEEQNVSQSNYFIIDSNPIWSVSDSTNQFKNVKVYLMAESAGSYQILKSYLRSNRGIVFLQLIFIIALIVGFILLSRLWPTHAGSKN